MAEGTLELEFTTTGAKTVLDTIDLIRRNASSAADMSRGLDISKRKQAELADASHRAALESKRKAETEKQAAISAERAAAANERSANASARTNPATMTQTSGGIAGGLTKGGNIKIEGANEFRASSELFSNGIRAAGVVLAGASLAFGDAANTFMQATGKIASFAGMGWGIGQGFGEKGGMIGAAFGLGWGVGSEIANWLYQDENETPEGKARLERLRNKNKARREARFEQAKFERNLSKVGTADEAKNLVKALEEQLSEAQLKFEHGLDGEGTMQEKQARLAVIENRLKEAQEVESRLAAQERAKNEAARLNRVSEIERNAGASWAKQNWQNEFNDANTERKIEMLKAKLEANSRVLAESNAAFRNLDMTDEQFQWHSDRYRAAQDEKISLQNQLRTQTLNLEKERKESAKKAAEESKIAMEQRAGEIASEYSKAGYSATGTELQRAGISFGGASSMQLRIAEITAESVKSILTKIETGTLDVAVKNKLPVLS